jgi:hypothetical protein
MASEAAGYREDVEQHRLMCLHIHQAPGPRNGRVVRHGLIQRHPHKRSDRQAVAGAPADPALRVDPFEVARHQQPEVDPRRQKRIAPMRDVFG